MEPFRYHVYVCDQRKPEGLPGCSARGSAAVIEALRREIGRQGLSDTVQVTTCGSLGLCERGPNLVVYPEGVWYSGVTPGDVPELVVQHFRDGRPLERLVNRDAAALAAEINANRHRMAAAQKAREAAGALPDELSEALRGYQASRILLSAVELDVFTAVARRTPATAENVAAALSTGVRATGVLMNALVALGVLAKEGEAFTNTPASGRFLVAGSPDDARASIRHNLSLWKTWSTLTDCVRAGQSVGVTEMRERNDDWTVPFIAAMHRNAALRAPLVVKAVGAEKVARMLDVGGGSGAYSIAFARANPALSAEILDLPPVVPIAARHIAEAGLSDRVHTRTGDLRADELGSGYDLVLASAVCHMLGPDENRDLFRRAFRALAPGGRIVLQDHVMDPSGTAPRSGALFAVNMLVGTPEGGCYTEGQYAAWLAEAGFAPVRHVPLAGPNDLMIAKRP